MIADYTIVGSGITGATIARLLADAGCDVVVVERRPYPGGNVHDYLHESGVRIHTYGPHYFRTNSRKIWSFVNRFAHFYRFEAIVLSEVDGRLEPWPVHLTTIRRICGSCTSGGSTTLRDPSNFTEASLAMMPEPIYRRFVHDYTAKQWGVEPERLSASLATRFEIRTTDDLRLKTHTYQGLPEAGYSAFVHAMLAGIPVLSNCDYLRHKTEFVARKLLLFTGPIDEYFAFDIGRLMYRGQRRDHVFYATTRFRQPAVQINYPHSDTTMIRSVEWKHAMPPEAQALIAGTVVTSEIPYSPSDPRDYEYPFPDEANRALYAAYRTRAKCEHRTVFCGRLGEYRYYDMDQAIGRAMTIAARILAGKPTCEILP